MELAAKNAEVMTPTKESHKSRSKNQESSKLFENFNPNLASRKSPSSKTFNSPVTTNSLKSASKNSNTQKTPQRKFITAKNKPKKQDKAASNSKSTCKCKEKHKKKCPCVAYENLRASQEEFLKTQLDDQSKYMIFEKSEILMTKEDRTGGLSESPKVVESPIMKRRREKLMEEARRSIPEGGRGRVMHLVKAFEKLLTIPNSKEKVEDNLDDDDYDDDKEKGVKWALPGLQPPRKAFETEVSCSCSSLCPSDLFLTSESLGLDPHVVSSSSSSCDENSIIGRFVHVKRNLMRALFFGLSNVCNFV